MPFLQKNSYLYRVTLWISVLETVLYSWNLKVKAVAVTCYKNGEGGLGEPSSWVLDILKESIGTNPGVGC